MVNKLGFIFPSLLGWEADEMSYHRYYDERIGLSHHRDNARFVGLIAVVSVMGEADFSIVNREPVSKVYDDELGTEVVDEWRINSETILHTSPNDLVLTRASGLYRDMKSEDRPEHAVINVTDLPRVSFMVRANSRPLDDKYGFKYYNWP